MIILILAALVGVACGSDHSDHGADAAAGNQEEQSSDPQGDEHGGHGEATSYGAPASPEDADRKVKVAAHDDFSYDPESIEVEEGEVVTFVVTNGGKIAHEFVLGDDSAHKSHAEEMADGHGNHGAGALSLDPGETGELTWHFSEAGEYSFACHLPGHYEAGMVGSITVE